MTQRWKYGNYTFTINPSAKDSSIEMVGDNVRTLSGAYISQPTAMQETHDIKAVFYQGRNRSISVTSFPNYKGIESMSGNLYSIYSPADAVYVFNENMTLQNTLSISGCTNKNYIAFDIQPDYTWVCSSSTGNTEIVYKVARNGTVATGNTVPMTSATTGLKYLNGYIWMLRDNGNLDQYRETDFAKTNTFVLPSGVGYSGLSSSGDYLVVGTNLNTYPTIYHVDSNNGNIVNAITFNMNNITDIAVHKDGTIYNYNSGLLQRIVPNTTSLDLYNLEKEIDGNKFVTLTDDMGISSRVIATNYSATRNIDYEYMFDVSMTITKVNRG